MQNKTYEYSPECREISGMGGSYEAGCRLMVITGVQWLDLNPGADITYKEYKNVYGVIAEESPDCKKLIDAMVKSVEKWGATGAMIQACLAHVRVVKAKGWEKYIKMMEEKEIAEE